MFQKNFGLKGDSLINAILAASTCGFLLFGYDQGVMSGIISNAVFNDDFPATKMADSDDVYHSTIQGTVTAVYEVGCLFGALLALFIGDMLGRRKIMALGAVIMIIGTIIMVTSIPGHVPLAQFIVGRVICGIGNGMNTSTIPSWQSETSKSHNRGAHVCFEASMIAIGTVIAYWIDFGLDFVDTSVAWRFPIAFQCIFAVILLVLISNLPESPRWLLTQHREEEALQIMADLNGTEITDPETIAQKEAVYESIRKSTQKVTNRELLDRGRSKNLRRTLIGASSQAFQQLGGCNAVIYYAPVLYQNSLGMDRLMAMILSGVTIIVYALFACFSFYLVEKVGRRPLFLWGAVGQCVAMVITFACLIPDTKESSKGATFGIFLFLAVFGATWLSLPWLYPAELSPLKIRTKANAISTSSNWLFNFLIVQVTPVMVASIHWGTYLFFAILNGLFIPIVYFYYPETKGRSLEELDVIFAKSHVENMAAVQLAKDEPFMEHHEILEAIRELELKENAEKGDFERGTELMEPSDENTAQGSLSEKENPSN
ncbi:sugar transporter Stl1p [[Candida] railenensis]|uniref:Sugar transporter Stl1p n=1 Tax=[Candida] railenensis TaxID=45579 RepID=A0A9P0VVW7_9ASCO|nr:sugar transporter Stl1p [[Candida] railenensis]